LKSFLLLFTIAVTIGTLTNVQIMPQVSKASPTARILVDPAKSSAKKDGTFTINIKVAEVDDLYSMSVYITYNPAILNYNYKGPVGADPGGGPDVVSGPFFTNYVATTPEEDSVFLVIKANQTEGWLDLATGLLGAATGVPISMVGPTGNTTLVITFRVIQTQATVIDIISSSMLNHYPAEIPHTVTNDGYYRPGDLAGSGGVASDGVVNIWDLVYVALGYGKTVSQRKNATVTAVAVAGWANPTYAYTSNDQYATCNTNLAAQVYYTYGFDTAQMSVIKKVLVGVEIKQAPYDSGEPEWVYIYISNNAGVSWATYKFKLIPIGSDLHMWADMTPAYTWTPSMLTDANLRVKIEYRKYGTVATTVSLDWIPVKVEYTQTAAFTDPNIDISGNGQIDASDLAIVAQSYGS